MSSSISELRIPADPAYIVVAKRASAGFASVAGFDVEAVHDLVIAVVQACENAIGCANRMVGPERGHLRLQFKLEEKCLEVQVQSSCSHAEIAAAEDERRAAHIAAAVQQRVTAEVDATDLAMRLMGLFVDDFGYRFDERTGGLRVRLTKYRVS